MRYHVVRRGECLWSLAHYYLGHGTRWPEILETHNAAAAKPVHFMHRPLLPITDENLIYEGQSIVMPWRDNSRPIPKGSGERFDGSNHARPFDLKVKYTLGRDTPPIEYVWPLTQATVKTTLSGDITLEIASADKRRHNIELALSKDSLIVKLKLYKAYDPAICALTAKPSMVYENGKVKIKAPFGTQAKAGPFTIDVKATTPTQMSGSIKPPTLKGVVKVNNTKYKFSADISLSVEVTWHPMPGAPQEVPVQVVEHQREHLRELSNSKLDWKTVREYADQILTTVSITILTLSIAPAISAMGRTMVTPYMGPFNYTIDPSRYNYPGDA